MKRDYFLKYLSSYCFINPKKYTSRIKEDKMRNSDDLGIVSNFDPFKKKVNISVHIGLVMVCNKYIYA